MTAGVIIGLALCLTLLIVGGGSGYGTTGVSSSGSGGQVVNDEVVQFSSAPSSLIAGLLLSWPLWVTGAVIVGISPLWTSRQKWTLQLLAPSSAIAMWALPALGWAISHEELGINLGAWTGLLLTLGGGGYLLLRLCRVGARRAAVLENAAL